MINIHVKTKAIDDTHLAMQVVYQRPVTLGHVPFTASNGVVIDVVGSGRPYLGEVNGTLVLGIRGSECPEEYSRRAIRVALSNAIDASKQMTKALKEFRRKVGR